MITNIKEKALQAFSSIRKQTRQFLINLILIPNPKFLTQGYLLDIPHLNLQQRGKGDVHRARFLKNGIDPQ